MSRAAYLAEWRRTHPANVARHRVQHAEHERTERAAGRRPVAPAPIAEPLPEIYPELRRPGSPLSFRREEIAMDLAQERVLASLEGRDPDRAVEEYREREAEWIRRSRSLADWR